MGQAEAVQKVWEGIDEFAGCADRLLRHSPVPPEESLVRIDLIQQMVDAVRARNLIALRGLAGAPFNYGELVRDWVNLIDDAERNGGEGDEDEDGDV